MLSVFDSALIILKPQCLSFVCCSQHSHILFHLFRLLFSMNNSDDESSAVSQVSISTCKEVNISDRSKWMWKMIKMDITAVPLQSGVQAPQWEFGGVSLGPLCPRGRPSFPRCSNYSVQQAAAARIDSSRHYPVVEGGRTEGKHPGILPQLSLKTSSAPWKCRERTATGGAHSSDRKSWLRCEKVSVVLFNVTVLVCVSRSG